MQPTSLLLGSVNNQPIAMAGSTDYGAFAYIGMVATRSDWQHKGIGTVMMRELLARLSMQRCPMVLLDATSAGIPLYKRLGFVDEGAARLYGQIDVVHPYCRDMNRVEVLREQDIPELIEFDRPMFGADRGQVLRVYGNAHPGRTLVVRDHHGRICGYLFAQNKKVGPWVARRYQDAEALFSAAITLNFEEAPMVIVPSANRDAAFLMEKYGYRCFESLRHMRLGRRMSQGDRAHIYSQSDCAVG
jgi:hypothetical protein